MRNWLKENLPGIHKFGTDFFGAMNNKKDGHSLRKWLAVGFYWLIWFLSMEFTTPENLVAVLTIHAGMIVSLVITYTAGNIQQMKIDSKVNKNTDDAETSEEKQ